MGKKSRRKKSSVKKRSKEPAEVPMLSWSDIVKYVNSFDITSQNLCKLEPTENFDFTNDQETMIFNASLAVHEDGCENIRDWVRKGRIDSCGMLKQLPNSADALLEGKFDQLALVGAVLGPCLNFMANFNDTINLLLAANHLALGYDKAREKCWECGKLCDSKKKCPSCCVAMYCCRECQVKAWKGGHEVSCDILKSSFQSYKSHIKTIDNFHSTGCRVVDDFEFDKMTDMWVACNIAAIDAFTGTYISTYLSKLGVKGPSFEVFHENVGRVVRGEFWIFPIIRKVEEVSLADVGNGGVDVSNTSVMLRYCECFRITSLLLSYDHFGFFAKKGITEGTEIMQNSQFLDYVENCRDTYFTERYRIEGLSVDDIEPEMHAEVYLYQYKKLSSYCNVGTTRSYKNTIAELFNCFLHKDAVDIRNIFKEKDLLL